MSTYFLCGSIGFLLPFQTFVENSTLVAVGVHSFDDDTPLLLFTLFKLGITLVRAPLLLLLL